MSVLESGSMRMTSQVNRTKVNDLRLFEHTNHEGTKSLREGAALRKKPSCSMSPVFTKEEMGEGVRNYK